ncbi:MAG TPA: MBOAT family O-acyltransferase, partial [Planctomycetota bacterium]|nr:MBOAT family O-acyltransferase [Planctomycetota bacterium]
MVFSSHIFVYYFLPAALLLYYASLPVSRYVWSGASALTLTFCSYVFYGWNRPDYCLLMLASSLLDFGCGRAIVRARAAGARGTLWLVVSLTGNLGLLAWFKYYNLMVDTWNDAVRTVGAEDAAIVDWARVALPVGISFYTFQTMSYTIDLWRGAVAPARSFWDFMAYVSMFPQLVAGPIVRYSHVAEELAERRHTLDKFYRGVLFFQFGLAKKVLIADNLSDLADQCFGGGRFAAPEALGALDAWTGTLAYAFQIYFDFSGYSDMAIGLGLMLGFSFPINFDRPYLAVSVTDFWRRWHLSLSTWLRDYLYIPLGGNRRGPLRTHVNLALTMLLGGLWHGAQ